MISVSSPSISETKPHLLVDEIELYFLFFHANNVLSKSDLITILTQDSLGDDLALSSAESNLKVETKVETCFRHFQYRFSAFASFYPFVVNSTGNLEIRDNDSKISIYTFLLVASMLSQVDKANSTMLAQRFEVVCASALKCWNPCLDVKIFGAGSQDRVNFFGRDTRDALCKLAEFVSATPIPHMINKKRTDGSYQISHSGDKGLDIVACQPFNDSAGGSFSIFGQCASKKEHWWHKKHEANPINFREIIAFKNDPLNMVFIPVCFRDSNGDWVEDVLSSGCLLIDRVRLCSMLGDSEVDGVDFNGFVAA